jgi:hypothetical protein
MKTYTTTRDTKRADNIVKAAAILAVSFVLTFSVYVTVFN